MRVSINKQSPESTGSIVFQADYTARSEIGLTGSNDLSFRVSPDGTNWSDVLQFGSETAHAGIGAPPNTEDRLEVGGSLKVSGPQSSFRFRDNGIIDMENDAGGIYLRSRTPGRYIYFGVTNTEGVLTNNAFYIRPDQQDVTFRFHIMPREFNSVDIGSVANPFRDLFLENAPTVSSDIRTKKNIETFDAGLDLIQALNPVTYERVGESSVRHIGLIAQQVRAALEEQGLENSNIWRVGDPEDPESRQAVSYTGLIPVLIDAVNELAERATELELSRD